MRVSAIDLRQGVAGNVGVAVSHRRVKNHLCLLISRRSGLHNWWIRPPGANPHQRYKIDGKRGRKLVLMIGISVVRDIVVFKFIQWLQTELTSVSVNLCQFSAILQAGSPCEHFSIT